MLFPIYEYIVINSFHIFARVKMSIFNFLINNIMARRLTKEQIISTSITMLKTASEAFRQRLRKQEKKTQQ